jgi:hypothetical protein
LRKREERARERERERKGRPAPGAGRPQDRAARDREEEEQQDRLEPALPELRGEPPGLVLDPDVAQAVIDDGLDCRLARSHHGQPARARQALLRPNRAIL